MSVFLKIVSIVYLLLVWATFFLMIRSPEPDPIGITAIMYFMIAIGLSIPAAALFAFGQLVGDVRTMRNHAEIQSDHLEAMRAYYEPDRRHR
jgi:hypothetical protein